jgi:hypothetical protein
MNAKAGAIAAPKRLQDRLLHSANRALFDSDLVASRLIIALAEWFWFVLLMWPGDTMQRPTYSIMGHVMHEEAWALLFLMSAIMQTTIVLTESYHSLFARMFAGFNAGLWSFIVVSMLLSVSPPPAAISGEISLALASIWIWMRPYIIIEGLARARSQHTRA